MTTPPPLTGPRFGRGEGEAEQLVVFLHGLGADGSDLIALAPVLARSLPDAAFVSPNAPFPCDMAPFGYQWFSFQSREPADILAGVEAAAPRLEAFLDAELARFGLADSALALVGFSQGAMMALHVAPRRASPCAAVLSYSGAVVAPERLAAEVRARPPVLLVHGDADEIVPFSNMAAAEAALKAAGLPVSAHRRPGLGHGIDETGPGLGLGLLQEVFGGAERANRQEG